MRHTAKSLAKEHNLTWELLDNIHRHLLESMAQEINEKEQLLIQKDQQLRNARIRVLRMEQRNINLKNELINMSELI